MVIQLEPTQLIKLFDDFVGNTDVMFNFYTDGKSLEIQVLGDYTAIKRLNVESIDGDYNPVDISFWVSKFIHIMSKDEYVRITVTNAAIFISQNSFYCTMLREYEERRQFPDPSAYELKHAFGGRLKYLAHSGVSCMCMAKELSIPDPDPVFTNNRFYLNYRQAAYIDSMQYPQMCLSFSVMRDFVFKLDEKSLYAYVPEKNVVYYKTANYEFWVPTVNHNMNSSVIAALDKKFSECKDLTEVTFLVHSNKLAAIAGAFPKSKLTLAIGKGVFNVSANTNNSHVQAGYDVEECLLTMDITSAQLTAITKLFGQEEKVLIKRGVGCICLKSGEKSLLIAGRGY